MVMAKNQFGYDFSSWCNLHLKFGKITSRLTLTERREAGNYHIIFWYITSKVEFILLLFLNNQTDSLGHDGLVYQVVNFPSKLYRC